MLRPRSTVGATLHHTQGEPLAVAEHEGWQPTATLNVDHWEGLIPLGQFVVTGYDTQCRPVMTTVGEIRRPLQIAGLFAGSWHWLVVRATAESSHASLPPTMANVSLATVS